MLVMPGNYHSVEFVYRHPRVVCARGTEVRLHVGL